MSLVVRFVQRCSLLVGFAMAFSLLFGSSLVFAGGVETTTASTNYISVNGVGKVSVDPDMAVVSFTVQTTDTTARLAQSANADIVHTIKVALTDAGSSTRNLKTTYFSTYPEYDYTYTDGSYEGEQYIKDYVTYHTFDLKVYDIGQVGDFADLVVQNGANVINNISYGVTNTDAAEVQARVAAFKQAKARAKQLATLAGGTLGNATSVSEWSYVPSCCDYSGNYNVSYDSMTSESLATTVPEPGQIEVEVDVSLMFEIKYDE